MDRTRPVLDQGRQVLLYRVALVLGESVDRVLAVVVAHAGVSLGLGQD
jgi:hypothetical protein